MNREEDGGKGRFVWGGVRGRGDAANTRARWDRTPKQLRVAVITQAKLPSMVCVHVCVRARCMHVNVRLCIGSILYMKLGLRGRTNADVRECEKEEERANKSWSKHSRAIKILEETGREWESEAASGESVSVVWEETMETKKVVLCCPRANEISQKQRSG